MRGQPVRPARGPKLGRPKGRFTQLRRSDALLKLLENHPRGMTLDEIALDLHITQRSVRRYLKQLANANGIEAIATVKGGANLWRIKPSERQRAVPLRRAQAYGLLATRHALDILRGSALFDEVENALAQIETIAETPTRTAKTQISGERELEERFFFLAPPSRSYAARGEELDELFRAVADLRVLRYRVRREAREAREARDSRDDARVVFHPYAMVMHKGGLFVIGARGRDGRDVEVVSFDRMVDLRASELEHFELPETFDVQAWIHGEFGLGRAARGRVIVEFDARVAEEVKSRKVHKDQRLATSGDGRVRVQLPLVNPDAIIGWILSFGDAARVVEPADMVERVGTILSRAASRYE